MAYRMSISFDPFNISVRDHSHYACSNNNIYIVADILKERDCIESKPYKMVKITRPRIFQIPLLRQKVHVVVFCFWFPLRKCQTPRRYATSFGVQNSGRDAGKMNGFNGNIRVGGFLLADAFTSLWR